ncbi:hypothetical protein C8Q77DRAFT_1159008 [Trametes polyzona]|nr:hypothetical protein C8Q77DRAFT_1159008 [Trametes polyzona]
MHFAIFIKLAFATAVQVAVVSGGPTTLEGRQFQCLAQVCTDNPFVCDCFESGCAPVPESDESFCASLLCGESQGFCVTNSDCNSCVDPARAHKFECQSLIGFALGICV